MKSKTLTIQMEVTEQHFAVVQSTVSVNETSSLTPFKSNILFFTQ